MEINQQQVKNWMQVTLSAGGPFAVMILHKTGISEGDYALYYNLALAILPGLIVIVWGWVSNRRVAQVAAVAQMPAAQVQEALKAVSDEAKVLVANAVPGVATVVIKDEANGKLSQLAQSAVHPNIVTETQNELDAKSGGKT